MGGGDPDDSGTKRKFEASGDGESDDDGRRVKPHHLMPPIRAGDILGKRKKRDYIKGDEERERGIIVARADAIARNELRRMYPEDQYGSTSVLMNAVDEPRHYNGIDNFRRKLIDFLIDERGANPYGIPQENLFLKIAQQEEDKLDVAQALLQPGRIDPNRNPDVTNAEEGAYGECTGETLIECLVAEHSDYIVDSMPVLELLLQRSAAFPVRRLLKYMGHYPFSYTQLLIKYGLDPVNDYVYVDPENYYKVVDAEHERAVVVDVGTALHGVGQLPFDYTLFDENAVYSYRQWDKAGGYEFDEDPFDALHGTIICNPSFDNVQFILKNTNPDFGLGGGVRKGHVTHARHSRALGHIDDATLRLIEEEHARGAARVLRLMETKVGDLYGASHNIASYVYDNDAARRGLVLELDRQQQVGI